MVDTVSLIEELRRGSNPLAPAPVTTPQPPYGLWESGAANYTPPQQAPAPTRAPAPISTAPPQQRTPAPTPISTAPPAPTTSAPTPLQAAPTQLPAAAAPEMSLDQLLEMLKQISRDAAAGGG